MNMLKKLCVTVFGSGYLPIAPGTWGSALGVILFLPIYVNTNYISLNISMGILIIFVSILGIFLGQWAIEYYKSNDPKQFVIDELAGMWLALLLMPIKAHMPISKLIIILLTQFVLFRIFDIIKPTPARQAEQLPAGLGIMTDDIIAGIYANITGQIIFRLLLHL